MDRDRIELNILIAAVGGQGALLASRVLGSYAALRGLDAKISEIHGMSQRGGSVVTHVRMGPMIHSPVVERGTADAVVAFELLEGARYAPFLRPGGLLVVSTQTIPPLPVLSGAATYPEDLPARLRQWPVHSVFVDAARHAEALGNAKAVNTFLLGVLARRTTDDPGPWRQAVLATVPPTHRDLNVAAFEAGWALRLGDDQERQPS